MEFPLDLVPVPQLATLRAARALLVRGKSAQTH